MATAFSALVEDLTLHRIGIRPNARDGAYNVMCWMERAQEVVAFMYYPGALSLARKAARADRVLAWTRPPDLPRVAPRRPWTAHEDELFERMSNAEVVARTRRSPASVAQRRKTLRKRDGSST